MSIPTGVFGEQPIRPIRSYWLLFVIEGLILLFLGAVAVVVPPIATLSITILIGWLLFISGVVGADHDVRRASCAGLLSPTGSPGSVWMPVSTEPTR